MHLKTTIQFCIQAEASNSDVVSNTCDLGYVKPKYVITYVCYTYFITRYQYNTNVIPK